MTISVIKGSDNVNYNLRDDVHTWGGRNYVLQSGVEISGISADKQFIFNWEELKGKTITVSCKIKMTNAVGGTSARVGFEPSFPRSSGGASYCGVWHNTANGATDNFSGVISATYTVPSDITGMGQRGIYIQRYTSGTVTIGYPKVEIGNKVTDWSPAPEDIAYVNGECLELLS